MNSVHDVRLLLHAYSRDGKRQSLSTGPLSFAPKRGSNLLMFRDSPGTSSVAVTMVTPSEEVVRDAPWQMSVPVGGP